MRATSWRRRSGFKITGDLSRLNGQGPVVDPKVTLYDADDPEGIDCPCGVRVRRLANGRPAGHAPGGYKTNTRKGIYKCEGSGVS